MPSERPAVWVECYDLGQIAALKVRLPDGKTVTHELSPDDMRRLAGSLRRALADREKFDAWRP